MSRPAFQSMGSEGLPSFPFRRLPSAREILVVAITPVLLAAVAAAGADLPLLLAFCVGGLALLTLGAGVVLMLTSLLGLAFHIWSQVRVH